MSSNNHTMAEEEYSEVNYKSICCEQIPDIFLDKLVAKKHFSKFGKINRFILRPKRLSCTVEYENEEDAERAVENAGNYNGYEFPICFAERDVGTVQNTEEWVDSEVQSELDAMGGGHGIARAPSAPSRAATIMPRLSKTGTWPKSAMKQPTEKEPSPIVAPKVDNALRGELEQLMRQPATTSEEKYRILDARDKLIRLTSAREKDISKAERRKGTCPDMCSEKERLMRDFQRQVAVFESEKSGAISHQRAIKEYSRSSADQEVPLPHELRPAPVLKMTMLYLMHRIMDLVETSSVNISDWFHFVWDRTRSIRKDITQQELCSLEAVELVEQCARFHIHCAARLVAEDPSVFDKKINAENLTKCLQTLKYLYHDLRLKNIDCPCESEFRSYIILLNLGNSNFLWEVKQLPENIQQSRAIRRAMTFYNVLQNNNYVRFFNMIREEETSYMSACILLGYFTKLRLRATEAIVKSHSGRKNITFIPLRYMTRILGFEDDEAAAQFFQYHGLICDSERGVLLDRPQPAADYYMERALKLVESKRTVSVGECVCGHVLDSPSLFENHQPHNSFDDNGLLKLYAWTADDQLRGEAAILKAQERRVQPTQAPQVKSTSQTAISLPTKASNSIFKVPQVSANAAVNQQKPMPSIFGGQANNSSTSGGFSFLSPKSSPSTKPAPTSGGNIFNKPTESGSIFGKNIFGTSPSKLPASNEPPTKPLDAKALGSPQKSLFQFFRTTPPEIEQAFKPAVDFNEHARQQQQAAEAEAAQKQAQEAENQKLAAAAEESKRQLELEQLRERQRVLEEAARLRQAETAANAAKARAAAERERKLAELQRCAEQQTESLMTTGVDEEVATIAKSEVTRYQTLEKYTQQLTNQLLDEFQNEEIRRIATEEYNIICHDRMLLERYFTRWLNSTRKKIKQRKLLDSTPIYVTPDTREELTAYFQHPSLSENMRLIKRYRHGEPCDFRKLLWDEETDLRLQQSIDICELIAKYVAHKAPIQRIQQRIYMKLLFTLPADEDELKGFESLCSKWLRNLLRFPPKDSNSDAYISTLQNNVALCVRKVSGSPPSNELGQRVSQAECDNVDGIVCFMSGLDLDSTRRRIYQLLQSSRNFKRLPLALVVYDSEYDEQELAALLELPELVERGKLCAYKFFGCLGQRSDKAFKVNLERALVYTIGVNFHYNADAVAALEMQATQNLLETCLGEEMWRRWHMSGLRNPAFRKVCSLLPHVVGLYNAAVKRLCEMLGENLQNEPEFPTELQQFVPKLFGTTSMPLGLPHFPSDWKSTRRQEALLEFVQSLSLPAVDETPPDDVNSLKMWLLEYAGRCIPTQDDDDNEEESTAAAYFAIKALVEQLKSPELETLEISRRLCLINYLPVIKPLVFARIDHQYKSITAKIMPAQVIYRHEALEAYLEQPWWLNYEAVAAVRVNHSLSGETALQLEETTSQDSLDDVETVLEKATAALQSYDDKLFATKRKPIEHTMNAELMRQLDQQFHELDVAKAAGVYELPVLENKTKQANKTNKNEDHRDSKSRRNLKRKITDDEPQSEVDAIIAKAMFLIEEVNAKRDLEATLDYATSQLEF